MTELQWEVPMVSHRPEETRSIAAVLVDKLPDRSVIALYGELGSGKTCFVQGLASALGITQPVTSPTFTIINEFRGARPLYHIDLYRLSGPDEILALGFDDYLEADGVTAIEWAERAGDLLPPVTVHVELAALAQPNERSILIRTFAAQPLFRG